MKKSNPAKGERSNTILISDSIWKHCWDAIKQCEVLKVLLWNNWLLQLFNVFGSLTCQQTHKGWKVANPRQNHGWSRQRREETKVRDFYSSNCHFFCCFPKQTLFIDRSKPLKSIYYTWKGVTVGAVISSNASQSEGCGFDSGPRTFVW